MALVIHRKAAVVRNFSSRLLSKTRIIVNNAEETNKMKPQVREISRVNTKQSDSYYLSKSYTIKAF